MKRVVGLMVASLIVAGCLTVPDASAADLTVYAASSLKGAMEAAATAYETAVPGAKVTLATDASSTPAHTDRTGCPGRRLPVRGPVEPEEACRRGT